MPVAFCVKVGASTKIISPFASYLVDVPVIEPFGSVLDWTGVADKDFIALALAHFEVQMEEDHL